MRFGSVDSEPTAYFILHMEQIKFYQYNGDNRTVNKILPVPVEMNGQIRNSFDLLTPVVTVNVTGGFGFNYCFIPVLGRYYFIESVTATGGNKYEISLSVDVLKTYENEIFAANGTVTESDNANKHISNRTTIYDRTPNYERINFPVNGLLDREGSIIMVTIKGNK